MGIAWDNDAWEEYLRWQAQDRRILKRINRLLRAPGDAPPDSAQDSPRSPVLRTRRAAC